MRLSPERSRAGECLLWQPVRGIRKFQSDEQVISVYKDQGVSVERGFRFLKNPCFYAESLYLKKPQRIMALIMGMTVSLLIYSLAEKRIREAPASNEAAIWDQKNKPAQRPAIRWAFMIFEDVLLLYYGNKTIEVMNIREEHIRVLNCLGSSCKKMCFL